MRERFAAVFLTRTRDEWVAHFAGADACVAPVNTTEEARWPTRTSSPGGTVVEVDGVPQPAPAPRFGRTPAAVDRPAPGAGEHTDEVLTGLGYSPDAVAALREAGAVTG